MEFQQSIISTSKKEDYLSIMKLSSMPQFTHLTKGLRDSVFGEGELLNSGYPYING